MKYSPAMHALRPGSFLILPLVLAFPSDPAAEQPRAAAPLTELVDFIAVSDDGKPVTNLTAAEITFKLDGRVRRVSSVQFVELASPVPVDRGTQLSAPMAPPYGSNRLEDAGRLVMIAIDRESIRPGRERPAREAALRFLSSLSPRDRVGLVTLPRVEVEPTNDHDQVRTALLGLTGLSSQERTASEAACRGRLVLNTLTGLLKTLVFLDGPKTIALISTGLMPPMRDAPMTGAPGQCEVRSVDFEDVGTAASAARAHFYVIQPNDEGIDSAASARLDPSASRFRSADDALAGLQHLTGATGGEIYRLSSVDPEKVFSRVASESSAYYVLAFEAEPGERNGLPHRVEIKVGRERVTVRTQPQFTILKSDSKAADITPQKMLRESRQYRDLPLRATAYASLNAGDSRLKVIAAAEPMDPSATFASVAVGLFDSKGKLAAQWTADREDLEARPLIAALAGAPGLYRVRVAAIDSTGRRGTVDYGFRADLESAGPLKLSAIALGVLAPGFRPRLQFSNEAAAVGFCEIYGVPPRAGEITVRIDIAESLEGPALVSSAARLQNTEDAARRVAIGTLALTSLGPGDYLVRAIVSLDGRPVGRIYRTLRKVKA
jgi:VWFA-related protein